MGPPAQEGILSHEAAQAIEALREPTLETFEFRRVQRPGIPGSTEGRIFIQPGNRDFGEIMMSMSDERMDPSRKILPFAWGRWGGGTNTTAFAILGYLFGRQISVSIGIVFAQNYISCLAKDKAFLSSDDVYFWVKEQIQRVY